MARVAGALHLQIMLGVDTAAAWSRALFQLANSVNVDQNLNRHVYGNARNEQAQTSVD